MINTWLQLTINNQYLKWYEILPSFLTSQVALNASACWFKYSWASSADRCVSIAKRTRVISPLPSWISRYKISCRRSRSCFFWIPFCLNYASLIGQFRQFETWLAFTLLYWIKEDLGKKTDKRITSKQIKR